MNFLAGNRSMNGVANVAAQLQYFCILSVFPPAGDNIQALRFQLGNHSRDIGWVVLQNGIEDKNDLPCLSVEASRPGGRLPKVAPKTDQFNACISLPDLAHHFVRIVPAAIVDENKK